MEKNSEIQIKLTNDDFEESYDADKYYLQISKIFDSEKQCKDFENQMLQNQEAAEKWNQLIWKDPEKNEHWHIENPRIIERLKKELKIMIEFWRISDEPFAKYYVDAYQSVYKNMFGKILEEKE